MSQKTALRTRIDAFCDEHWPGEEIVLFGDTHGDPYDAAFIGIGSIQHQRPIAVYDREKAIAALAAVYAENTAIYEEDADADPYTDAVEFFTVNTEGSYVGEQTPLIISRFHG